ncbi:hypothetical protein DRB87_15225 [Pandoraea sp. XY-2]|nr:hypothetical protein DRB87_15225 [Pandoraea sp. XY-2]
MAMEAGGVDGTGAVWGRREKRAVSVGGLGAWRGTDRGPFLQRVGFMFERRKGAPVRLGERC